MRGNNRYHSCHAGEDSKATIWKFQGNEALWLAASCALAILMFRLLAGRWQWPLLESVVISGIPPVLTAVFLLRLVVGKPPSHAADWLEWQSLKARNKAAELGICREARPLVSHRIEKQP